MDLAREYRLDGVSLWALGFDDAAVWDQICEQYWFQNVPTGSPWRFAGTAQLLDGHLAPVSVADKGLDHRRQPLVAHVELGAVKETKKGLPYRSASDTQLLCQAVFFHLLTRL